MTDDFNPFTLNSYYGTYYFCDRKNELDFIKKNIKNRNSTTLISQRRMGKTSLIQHLFHSLPPKHIGISIDIMSTTSRRDLLNTLTTAIALNVPSQSSFGKKVWDFIRSLQPNISFDPLTGSPQVSINITTPNNDNYIESIFNFLEIQPQKIVIAIDEFQQILNYPEENTDAWLRTFIQKLNNVIFIFSGSRTHLMSELFSNPARPFYRSTQFINLDKIDSKEYTKFIIKHFKKSKRKMPSKVICEILDWTYGHTYYVQALCSRIYDMDVKEIDSQTWKTAAYEILKSEEIVFLKFRDLLPTNQWKLMKAIAIESKVYKPTANKFTTKYKLGTSATVLKSLKALINKDMLYIGYNEDEQKFYSTNDVFFERWAQWKNHP